MKKKILTILFSALALVGTAGIVTACEMGATSSVESSAEKTTAVVHLT
ncbi:MAG: hypothetical protein IKA57_06370 [Clostridia bacterium]|nr:hypothetical protein [Clostridia bacterium]